jgi:lipoprotein-releasing system permease protein
MSRLPFELHLALRYLRPKRSLISVIPFTSVVGVMLGVAVLIIVISVMSGFHAITQQKILGFNAHLKVYQQGAPLRDHARLAQIVSSNKAVRAVSPFVMGKVLIETRPPEGSGRSALVDAPWLRGIDAERERRVSNLHTNIVAGEFSVRGNGLLIGRQLAQALHLGVGDQLAVYSTRQLQTMKESRDKKKEEVAIKPDEYTVRGIFDVGYYEYNVSVIVSSLPNAQDLYDLGENVHGLMVMLDDPFKVEAVRRELHAALNRDGGDYLLTTWPEENAGLLQAVMVEKSVMFYILFFIMIVAAFGISSVLITFVVQKTREIGILKALGATRAQIAGVFLAQSLVVGTLGVFGGFVLGRLALAYRNEFLELMRRLTGFELFPQSIYNLPELPALILPGEIAPICGGSLLLCVVAGLLPAWYAGRLKPVEALRYE